MYTYIHKIGTPLRMHRMLQKDLSVQIADKSQNGGGGCICESDARWGIFGKGRPKSTKPAPWKCYLYTSPTCQRHFVIGILSIGKYKMEVSLEKCTATLSIGTLSLINL